MGISLEQLTNSVNKVMTKVKDKFVSKEEGKGLSTNDYSTEDKSKVAKIDTIENSIEQVSSQIDEKANLSDVAKISSGTPLFASSVAEMIDKTKNYVNITDGYLYIYNGTIFEKTNVMYQATGIADGSIGVKKFDNLLSQKFTSIIVPNKEILSNYMSLGIDSDSKIVTKDSIECTSNTTYGSWGWNIENKDYNKFLVINKIENVGNVKANFSFLVGYRTTNIEGSISKNGEQLTEGMIIEPGNNCTVNCIFTPQQLSSTYKAFACILLTNTNGATLRLTQTIYNVTELTEEEINSIDWNNPISSIQLMSDIAEKAKSLDSNYEESLKSNIIEMIHEPIKETVIDTIGKNRLLIPPNKEVITTYMKNGVDTSSIVKNDNTIEFTTNSTFGTLGFSISNIVNNKYLAISEVSNLGDKKCSVSLMSAYANSELSLTVISNGDYYDTFSLEIGESKKVITKFISNKADISNIGLCVFSSKNGATLRLTQTIYNVTELTEEEINSIDWNNPTSIFVSDIAKRAEYADDISAEKKIELLSNKWYGKTILSIGDSLSAAKQWQLVLETKLGVTVKHHSKGGMGLIQMVDGDKGLGGDYDNTTDANGELKPLSIEDVTGVDLIIFFGGYNNRGTADGELGDVYNPDDQTGKTIAGMTQYCINRIYEVLKQANNLTCKILIVTPHCAGKYDYIDVDGYEEFPSGSGCTMETLSDTIKLVGNYNSIKVLDLWHNSGINKFTWNVYANKTTPDNTTYTKYELNSSGEIVGTTPLRYVKGNSYYQIRDGVVTLEQYTGSAPYPYNNDQLHLNNTEGYPHIGEIITNEVLIMQ